MPRLVGINHIAVEVGDVDEMLAFLEQIFDQVTLRGRSGRMAFVDMGDQFVALEAVGREPVSAGHFGLVVDDAAETLERAREAGARMVGTERLPRPVGQPVAGRGLPRTSSSRRRRGSSRAWDSRVSRSPSARSRSCARRVSPTRSRSCSVRCRGRRTRATRGRSVASRGRSGAARVPFAVSSYSTRGGDSG